MKRLIVIVLSALALAGVAAFGRYVVLPYLQKRDDVHELIRQLDSSDPKARMEAARQLGEKGSSADAAVRPLNRLIKREERADVRGYAAVAVAKISKPDEVDNIPPLIDALSVLDNTLRQEAVTELMRFETKADKAIPALQALLNDPDAEMRRVAAVALVKVGSEEYNRPLEVLIASLQSDDVAAKLQTIKTLGDIGEPAGKATEALERLLGEPADSDIPCNAAISLAKIQGPKTGAAAIQVLIDSFHNKDVSVRTDCINTLTGIGPPAAKAVEPLLALLSDRNATVKYCAAVALANIKKDAARPAIPSLIRQGLYNTDPGVRQEAAGCLAMLGPNAREAVEPLSALLEDSDPKVRLAVAKALVKIRGSEAVDVPPVLTACLRDENAQVRKDAIAAVEEIGPITGGVVEALRPLLKDADPDVRQTAVAAWVNLHGEGGGDAVPALLDMLKAQEADVRLKALSLLGNVGGGAADAVGPLEDLLKDADPDMKRAIAYTLVRIQGAKARGVMPILLAGLGDKTPDTRRECAALLARFGKSGTDAVPVLTKLLTDADAQVKWTAAGSILSIKGAEAKDAISIVATGLKNSKAETRMQSAKLLGDLGAAALPQADAIAGLLNDPEAPVKRTAAMALTKISPAKAKAALPVLLDMLAAEDGYSRALGCQGLGAMGPEAASAVDALMGLEKDREKEVREAAAEAIKRISKK